MCGWALLKKSNEMMNARLHVIAQYVKSNQMTGGQRTSQLVRRRGTHMGVGIRREGTLEEIGRSSQQLPHADKRDGEIPLGQVFKPESQPRVNPTRDLPG